MSDEMKELRRRLINAMIDNQHEGHLEYADGIKIALYELEHLDKPYTGPAYFQGDGDDD